MWMWNGDFNPRSRVGNDIVSIWNGIKSSAFQSTFPRGERQRIRSLYEINIPFQSTFPRGERPFRFLMIIYYIYFNPRSRVGNDVLGAESIHNLAISIHVPAWGTTQSDICKAVNLLISIHVPAWGTTRSCVHSKDVENFNPRSRVGNDATIPGINAKVDNFNPRSRVGNDSDRLIGPNAARNFNPRSRVGNDCYLFRQLQKASISIHVPAWGTTPLTDF